MNNNTGEFLWRGVVGLLHVDIRCGRRPLHGLDGLIKNGMIFGEHRNIKLLGAKVVGRDPAKKILDGELLQRSDKVSTHPLPVRTKEFIPNLQVGRLEVRRWNANMLKTLIQ